VTYLRKQPGPRIGGSGFRAAGNPKEGQQENNGEDLFQSAEQRTSFLPPGVSFGKAVYRQ
jgi:hypothetical protein